MLDVLGLDTTEAAAYRRLIEIPSGTAEDLSADLALSHEAALRVLTGLEAKGLVARSSSERGRRFVASPPAIALGALLVERQEELRLAQEEEITENAPKADDGDSEFEDVDPDPDEEHEEYDELPPDDQEI